MRFLAIIGLLAILVGAAAAAFFFGGFYSVAGTQEEPAIVASALIRVRTASIDRHAVEAPPISLNDAAAVRQGARVFAVQGCAACHGGPGVDWAKFSEGLHPSPPDLKDVVGELEPREIFWVVKNGINMTGMPSFGQIDVPDRDIWAVVAFLKKLPTVSNEDFKSWSAAPDAGAAAP